MLGCDKESHPSFETLPPTAANKEGVWLARVPWSPSGIIIRIHGRGRATNRDAQLQVCDQG